MDEELEYAFDAETIYNMLINEGYTEKHLDNLDYEDMLKLLE